MSDGQREGGGSRGLLPCLVLILVAAAASGCGSGGEPGRRLPAPPTPLPEKPNVLLIVWDTARADRMGAYGYDRPTTPFLDGWAEDARVFEDCVSVGSTTVPSHASMFTGLMPPEHDLTNENAHLADVYHTLAERMHDAGYRTYAYIENPQIDSENNFTQGFDVEEHPSDPEWSDQAKWLTLAKMFGTEDRTVIGARLQERMATLAWKPALRKGAGELVEEAVAHWLGSSAPERPFFVFLNYMTVHRPFVPARRHRRAVMTPEQVRDSYVYVDDWMDTFSFTFGMREPFPGEMELNGALYDAAVRELDDLLRSLILFLRNHGYLDNTVVVLTSDHGEHLGEHHLLDHQYSVYEPLMRVPLLIWYPRHVVPGRETRPVMNVDLYQTLLHLAGIEPDARSRGLNLFRVPDARPRLGVYAEPMTAVWKTVARKYPDFDPRPWDRSLMAYYDGPYKWIRASDGRHELYRTDRDPAENENLADREVELARRLDSDLEAYLGSLSPPLDGTDGILSDERREQLRQLGYITDPDAE